MKLLDIKKINYMNHDRIIFIRVEPKDINKTLKDIVVSLSDLSWLNQFDESFVRDCFEARAISTILDITSKLKKGDKDDVTSDAGEYIVSELARRVIIEELTYLDIPISELYSKKKSGNPGFDFHTQNEEEVVIFGEAKYIADKNAYGSGLRQIIKFIEQKKDIKDLADLRDFISDEVLRKANQGTKGFAVGFSSKEINTDILMKNIVKNKDFKELCKYKELILVAVNI